MSATFEFEDGTPMTVLSPVEASQQLQAWGAAIQDRVSSCPSQPQMYDDYLMVFDIMGSWELSTTDIPPRLVARFLDGRAYPTQLYNAMRAAFWAARGSADCTTAARQIADIRAEVVALDAAWAAAEGAGTPPTPEAPRPPAPEADPVTTSTSPVAQALRTGLPTSRVGSGSSKAGMIFGIAAILVGGAILWGTVK